MSASASRRADAAHNDRRIRLAARQVFGADPDAPVAAVAGRAGVGIGALYRRYPSKEALVWAATTDALRCYRAAAQAALATSGHPWSAFAGFMRHVVDADAACLALTRDGDARALTERLVDRFQTVGVLRPDLTADDLVVIFRVLAVARLGDARRTRQLRRRYLALILDALGPGAGRAQDRLRRS